MRETEKKYLSKVSLDKPTCALGMKIDKSNETVLDLQSLGDRRTEVCHKIVLNLSPENPVYNVVKTEPSHLEACSHWQWSSWKAYNIFYSF